MNPETVLSSEALRQRPLRLSPTDASQYINLDQCRRFLRLRLHDKAAGSGFLDDYGVHRQQMPEMLARAGTSFETEVVEQIKARFDTVDFAPPTRGRSSRKLHNDQLVERARSLRPGSTIVLLQPRLDARLGDWLLRGDIDILKLHRDADGSLHALVADIKSSAKAKVEHRLQIAFYHDMLTTIFEGAGIALGPIEMAVLYQGPRHTDTHADANDSDEMSAQRRDALETFGVTIALLDRTDDPDSYLSSVRELVTGPGSTALDVAGLDFEAIPYHLTYKCDWCPYNEFCMKWSAERDDLSLIPHLTETEKSALKRSGLTTISELAYLKELRRETVGDRKQAALVPVEGNEELVRTLAATWPVGPRLDELIHRARRYRRLKRDEIDTMLEIPSKGYGSLPYSDAAQNPNLVRVYIDAQHDYVQDRIYLLGALIAACEGGVEAPKRRRAVVRMTDGPPDAEREGRLFLDWVTETVRAVIELAAPDLNGDAKAPIHLIFFNRFDQRLFLDGLGRHATTVLGATPLYDFVTQLAAFDSPIVTFLVDEIRELKNYPMVCQSLQQVAAHLKFAWNSPEPYRDLFRGRLFDFWAKFAEAEAPNPEESPWYTGRSRFNSQVPLEYAYGAWGELGPSPDTGRDGVATFRETTPDLLQRFQLRRLEALEWITHDFKGNHRTEKTPFTLPDLTDFDEKARSLAQALDEFVIIERHVRLGGWKAVRNAPPERRVLSGESLTVRYLEADQPPGVADQNRDHIRRQQLYQERRTAYFAANPDAKQFRQTKEERAQTHWTHEGLLVRLRIDRTDWDCNLDEALTLSEFGVGDSIVLNTRWMVDGRKPVAEQVPFTPTPKKMLYGTRARIAALHVDRDDAGRATDAVIEVEMNPGAGQASSPGFLFRGIAEPFKPDEPYTIDSEPNDIMGFWHKKITEGLCAGGSNALYDRLTQIEVEAPWPVSAVAAQQRFLDGVDALLAAGHIHDFEPSKRAYISAYGDAPVLLVQGPPGTGKSYTTAFALFARWQGAVAADIPFRVLLSCKTHAATDVLLKNVRDVREDLRLVHRRHPDLFRRFFDERLLDLPLYRVRPRGETIDGVIPLKRKAERPKEAPAPADVIASQQWCVAASTPGGVYGVVTERWSGKLFGHELIDCLVLDEASQMNLPEAIMAALPLKQDGRVIIVGDPRQMPPIVHHDWLGEPRRTFTEFKSYQSLYQAFFDQIPSPPQIQFAESFRLHADLAEFLRREVYRHDGIAFHSNKHDLLDRLPYADPFVDAVLRPEHPLVVIVHDEAASQVVNAFEQALITPVLEALASVDGHGFDPRHGLGVVVPHRKQRAALQESVPCLSLRDPITGLITLSAVDTVERFQGDERQVILVSATESDREYLLVTGDFLLDPRRLTVALSRAKRKMILVAARSVFTLFSADDETFANSQLWKNLLRRTCTVPLWSGARDGHNVEVWGNPVA